MDSCFTITVPIIIYFIFTFLCFFFLQDMAKVWMYSTTLSNELQTVLIVPNGELGNLLYNVTTFIPKGVELKNFIRARPF